MDWAITIPVFCHAVLLPLPVTHAKTTMNPVPPPVSPQDGLEKIWAQGKLWQNRGSQGEEDHPQTKGTEEIIPASTVSGGKEKQIIHWELKENSFLNCWDPQQFLCLFKVVSEEKTSCEANVLLHLTWYQQILTLERISLQHRAPRDCGREEGDDNSTILLKDSCKYTGWVFKLGRLICELKLLQVHLFGQGVLQCLVRKCRWDWIHIKSLLLAGNPRLPYRS